MKILFNLLFVGLILPLAVGCSGSDSDAGSVTGVVKINGVPVENAAVSFSPAEGGRTAIGRTGADGSYELNYTPGVKGAKLGANSVNLSTYEEPKEDDNDKIIRGTETKERFPPEFNSGESNTVEVKSGSNEFDFDVKADKDSYPAPK